MGCAGKGSPGVKRVVADTGPILHLWEAKAWKCLTAGCTVSIPPEVEAELGHTLPNWLSRKPAWLNIAALHKHHQRDAQEWSQAGLLDSGEAAAIALGRQTAADWFLTDDAAARLFAQALGLEVHGSLGVLLWAAGQKIITPAEAKASLDGLAESTLWVSPRILKEARTALEELIK